MRVWNAVRACHYSHVQILRFFTRERVNHARHAKRIKGALIHRKRCVRLNPDLLHILVKSILSEVYFFMAIYHLHVGIISRKTGRSSVGASAYRAGEKLHNEYDGITHDYTNRNSISSAAYRSGEKLGEYDFTNKRGVVYSEIILPVRIIKNWWAFYKQRIYYT